MQSKKKVPKKCQNNDTNKDTLIERNVKSIVRVGYSSRVPCRGGYRIIRKSKSGSSV